MTTRYVHFNRLVENVPELDPLLDTMHKAGGGCIFAQFYYNEGRHDYDVECVLVNMEQAKLLQDLTKAMGLGRWSKP